MTAKLYIFSISHYCEKARWALDYFDIDYELVVLAPGSHASKAKKLGAAISSLPILETGSTVIQGSSDIIDWAEDATQSGRSLTPKPDESCSIEECMAVEKRLDDIIGVHVRRMFYSEALVEFPETVKPIFTKGLPLAQSLVVRVGWSKIREAMIKRMNLGREQGDESKTIIDAELAWLDEILQDGRQYLLGDRLTRADICAAALMAVLAGATQHPFYELIVLPPRARAVADEWHGRPSMQFVRRLYQQHRSQP